MSRISNKERERILRLGRNLTGGKPEASLAAPSGSQPSLFNIGNKVEKFTGDYQLAGIVVAVFYTTKGKLRYVVEHEPGFLHIYNETQLRLITTT